MQYFKNHVKWHRYIPLPSPQSEGQQGVYRLLLCGFMFWGALRLNSTGKWLFVCIYLCFIQSLLLELRLALASESGLLWFMWSLWRQAIFPGTFPIPSKGDMAMKAETNGSYLCRRDCQQHLR